MNFKTRFLYGLCDFDAIDDEIAAWHEAPEQTETLEERLGFTNEEQSLLIKGEEETFLKMLLAQRRQQAFRIYQLRLDEEHPTVPFAFGGIETLHKAGFEQPPAAEYNQVYDGILPYIDGEDEQHRLDGFSSSTMTTCRTAIPEGASLPRTSLSFMAAKGGVITTATQEAFVR